MNTDIKKQKSSCHRLMLEGMRFGHVVAQEYLGNSKWLCLCDCGNTAIGTVKHLLDGGRRSCGKCKYRYANYGTHKESKTRLWRIWDDMKTRCNNPNARNYKNYGQRGIKICPEWSDFSEFRSWAYNNGYSDGLSIDRIDVDKDYCPGNCRWATMKEQGNNKRNNNYLTFNGETKTIMQWSEEKHMLWATLKGRLKAGWSIEAALNTPVKKIKKGQNDMEDTYGN